jgi:hypothetical protein
MENLTNGKAFNLAVESRTVASAAAAGAGLIVRFAQIRNSEIQTFGHHVPVRRRFCGRLQPGAEHLSTD